jgi:hypothetical protein
MLDAAQPMPSSSFLIQQVLEALRADGLVEIPRTARLQSVHTGSTGAPLFRIHCTLGDGSSPSFILKRVGQLEYNIYRLLSRELPDTVPKLIGAWPASQPGTTGYEGEMFLLMEDVTCGLHSSTEAVMMGPDGFESRAFAANATAFREALRLLSTSFALSS